MNATLNHETACLVVQSAVDAIQSDAATFPRMHDDLPAAIYVTDAEGTITYFNRACVELAGRVPTLGADKWCVTWKIYSTDGERVPHEECPMAVAIREQRPLRDVEALAERPDGSRIHFVPYPTPLFAADGRFVGAVNLLLDVTQRSEPDYLRRQSARCRRLAASVDDRALAETLERMAATYEEQADKPGASPRLH